MGEQKQKLASVQVNLPIDTIREGVVIMKDGSLRNVVMVSTLNFALKSEKEKESVIGAYQEFLNALEFPIQLLATTKKLDLSAYMSEVESYRSKEQSPLIKIQLEEYGNFINALLEQANIMEKRFFAVIPYYGSTDELPLSGLPGFGKKKKTNAEDALTANFESKKDILNQRTEHVINGLSSLGLRCVALGTEDLLQLYYSTYNPSTSKNQKVSAEQDIDAASVRKGSK